MTVKEAGVDVNDGRWCKGGEVGAKEGKWV